MKFVKMKTSDLLSPEIIEINNLDELLKIQKNENVEIIIGRDGDWRKHYTRENRKLYEQADGWYIEIYDAWRE